MASPDYEDDYDELYYDDESLFFIDDTPLNEVDDLAERTLYSPVLINYDPGFIDDYSGWEYETDDYYDGDASESQPKPEPQSQKQTSTSTPGKRRLSDSVSRKRKRRKQGNGEEDIPELDLGEAGVSEAAIKKLTRPAVVWRTEEQRSQEPVPLVEADGEGTKVSLLKDWRERLGIVGRASGASVNGDKSKVADYHEKEGGGKGKIVVPSEREVRKETHSQETRGSRKRPREEDGESIADDEREEDSGSTSGKGRETKRKNPLEEKGQNEVDRELHSKANGQTTATNVRKSKRLKSA